MKRLALLCLLISGCGVAHGGVKFSSSSVKRKGKPKPAVVKPVSTAAGNLAPTSPQKEAEIPAAASRARVIEALDKGREETVTEYDNSAIDSISHRWKREIGEEDPLPNPNPSPNPNPTPTPPFLTLPATVEGDIGDYIEIKPQTNCKAVHWLTIDKGLKRFPDSALSDPTMTVVSALVPGQYRLAAFAASGDEPVGPVEVMVVVHGAQPPPVPPTPPVPPLPPVPPPVPPAPPPPAPPVPPVAKAGKLWAIIALNSAASIDPATASITGDLSFWNAFQAQGHEFRVFNPTQPQYAKYRDIVSKNCDKAGHCGAPAIIILDATKVDSTGSAPWLNQGKDANGNSLTGIPVGGTAAVKALVNSLTSRPVP